MKIIIRYWILDNFQILLEPLKLYGEGNYALTSVKEVKVTKSFLLLSEETRNCQNRELYEDCLTREFGREAMKICSCVPDHLLGDNNAEVWMDPFKVFIAELRVVRFSFSTQMCPDLCYYIECRMNHSKYQNSSSDISLRRRDSEVKIISIITVIPIQTAIL